MHKLQTIITNDARLFDAHLIDKLISADEKVIL